MTSIPGNKKVIVDSDALIGLINEDDLLHERALKISSFLVKNNFFLIIPFPTVLEASTTLFRATKRPDLAKKLLSDFAELAQPPIREEGISKLVADSYDPKASRKNTPFDHYVCAVAKMNNIELVFSFDDFYEKQGLILVEKVAQ